MKRLLRWILRIAAFLLAIAVLYTGYIAWEVRHYARTDQARAVDAIVVLGAAQYNGKPSPVLQARLDHAADLYSRGYASYIVVTGGKIPGDVNTEAGASASYLATLGVADSHVLREVQGRNSWQSLQAAARFMQDRNIHRVLLVSDSFHDARIRQMAKDLGLDAYVSPTSTSPIAWSARQRYLMKEVVALGVGRLIGFNRIASLESSFASTS